MIKLIPSVKVLVQRDERLTKSAIYYNSQTLDDRLAKALSHLPFDENGAPLTIELAGTDGEGYTLDLLGALAGILEKDLGYFVCEAATESPNYRISDLTKELELLSDENRRIITTTVKAMLEEQD